VKETGNNAANQGLVSLSDAGEEQDLGYQEAEAQVLVDGCSVRLRNTNSLAMPKIN
jgi:hypothetical protein